MLAKRSRLAKEKDFKTIFKRGKSFYVKIFGVKALANGLKENRYGIVISSKVSKKSVERNRLKRRLRAALKEADEKLVRGLDLIVIVSPAAKNQTYGFIKSQLDKALSVLKLFK